MFFLSRRYSFLNLLQDTVKLQPFHHPIRNLPSGWRTALLFLLSLLKNSSMEIGAILPIYMASITIIFPAVFSDAVNALDSPTVPNALKISYAADRGGMSFVRSSSSVNRITTIKKTVTVATALKISWWLTFLPYMTTSSC